MRIETGLVGLYTFATVAISLLFLSIYYFSGSEFCLLPVGLVLFDYIKTIRIARRQREVDENTIRESRWELERAMRDTGLKPFEPFEFILEEEFKV